MTMLRAFWLYQNELFVVDNLSKSKYGVDPALRRGLPTVACVDRGLPLLQHVPTHHRILPLEVVRPGVAGSRIKGSSKQNVNINLDSTKGEFFGFGTKKMQILDRRDWVRKYEREGRGSMASILQDAFRLGCLDLFLEDQPTSVLTHTDNVWTSISQEPGPASNWMHWPEDPTQGMTDKDRVEQYAVWCACVRRQGQEERRVAFEGCLVTDAEKHGVLPPTPRPIVVGERR